MWNLYDSGGLGPSGVCLGTDTVVSREHLLDLARDPRFFPENIARNFAPNDDEEEENRERDLHGDDIYGW